MTQNNNFARGYSRLILHSIIEHSPFLWKLCKALCWCKTLRKGIEKGEIFGTFFPKKYPFWPILNTSINFYNMLCLVFLCNIFKIPFKSILWFWLVWPGIPKVLKIGSLQCLYNISDKKLKMRLMFCMQINTKVNFNTLDIKEDMSKVPKIGSS